MGINSYLNGIGKREQLILFEPYSIKRDYLLIGFGVKIVNSLWIINGWWKSVSNRNPKEPDMMEKLAFNLYVLNSFNIMNTDGKKYTFQLFVWWSFICSIIYLADSHVIATKGIFHKNSLMIIMDSMLQSWQKYFI